MSPKESVEEWWKEEFLESLINYRRVMLVMITLATSLKVIIPIWYTADFITHKLSIITSAITMVTAVYLYRVNLKYNLFTVWFSILSAEAMNIFLFLMSRHIGEEAKNLLLMETTLITVLLESSLIKSLILVNIVLLKHILMWYGYNFLFGLSALPNPIQMIPVLVVLGIHTSREFLVRNISYERYSYRKKLEWAERRLAIILRAFPDGLIIFDTKFSPELINEKMLDYLDCTENLAIDKLRELEYVEDKKFQNLNSSSRNLFRDLLSYSNLSINEELILGIVQIGEIILQFKVKKISIEGEEVLLLSASDSRQLIELEQSAAENRTKKFMLRTISHELRTPISAIISFADQVYEICTDTTIIEKISHIRISANLLLHFINGILDYTQLIQGMFKPRKVEFNIRDKISECYELFQYMAKRKGINLFLRIDPDLPEIVYTDPDRLSEVLLNLLSNAIKFTTKGRIELIAIYTEDERLKIYISDTGIGIPEERYSQIFKLFRNSSVDQVAQHGCGLGLHLSNLIAFELGNSEIQVSSMPQRGSVFGFKVDIAENNDKDFESFDCTQESLEFVNSFRHFDSIHNYDYPQVLIVDDNELNREILAAVLSKHNIKFLEAVNGHKAVKMTLKQNSKKMPFKLIIMDISMPIMDGWEATKRIKQLYEESKLSYMPAIVGHTAYTSEKDVMMCYASGMISYLAKPAASEAIYRVLRQFLQLK